MSNPLGKGHSHFLNHFRPPSPFHHHQHNHEQTRSSWLNCALRDDEAVYWVSKGQYEAVAVGN